MPTPCPVPRAAPAGWGDRGFTLVELMVVVIAVGVLAYLLLGRLLVYREAAERAAMEQTVGSLQSALTIAFSRNMVLGRGAEALAAENPTNWLAKPPDSYVGELHDPAPGQVEPGKWYFDTRTRHLVYTVRFGEHFRGPGGRREARFHVRLVTSEDRDKVVGAVIEPVAPFTWRPD
jgi:prepilin-type N-terminal cleavage/methylation domain-containing protein